MAPSVVHLPNGHNLNITPVFGGLGFRSNELNTHHNPFPPGWTIVLNSEDDDDDGDGDGDGGEKGNAGNDTDDKANIDRSVQKKHTTHRYTRPGLRNDHMYISSISNPANSDFKAPSSPTRQIAMMLWATLWWYFHQPAPSPYLTTPASRQTPEEGRPKGEWRVNINREGIFKGKHLLPKLERMGLIASEDSSVGLDPEDGVGNSGEGWCRMFVSQRSFWQLDARIYLFSLSPANLGSPYPSISPATSRPTSPNRGSATLSTGRNDENASRSAATAIAPHLSRAGTPAGPFTSSSHLPTFYPPPPPQYTFTHGRRHPVRPKPPRQGETFYTRYVPSLGQYLSFRVASLAKTAVAHRGPTATAPHDAPLPPAREILRLGTPPAAAPSPSSSTAPAAAAPDGAKDPPAMSDVDLLHKWMNDPRVAHSWGEAGPRAHQEAFLRHALAARHSFPVIGCFDGRPFGFFEIYWAPEDRLAAHLPGAGTGVPGPADWDRGLHVLVGEPAFRGPQRVRVWLSALVHYCFLADLRTAAVWMEPRVDNVKLRNYCEDVGFHRAAEVAFAHKQSNVMKMPREAFQSPVL